MEALARRAAGAANSAAILAEFATGEAVCRHVSLNQLRLDLAATHQLTCRPICKCLIIRQSVASESQSGSGPALDEDQRFIQ